ncbi:MAG: DUF5626 family protein [Tyzzerella sp.]|nr:DUF5626 family protein [Tyzzerella sp.]
MKRIQKCALLSILTLVLIFANTSLSFASESSVSATYNLPKGGTQIFFIENKNGEIDEIIIEKLENNTRVADDTYHVYYKTSNWTAGFYLKILNNKIMSISSPYHSVNRGTISNTFFHLNSHYEQTGLSKSALGSYESDDYKDISHYALNKLADFYGVTTDYLLARAEIMEKYQPGEHDKDTYLLQAAHVNEGDYFSSRVHNDIDGIMEDLREAHRGRSDGAPKTSVAEELKRDLEEVANFEGSRVEQLLMIYCKQTKLRYNKLTEEEKQWLVRIMQKSELMKSHTLQRGKKKEIDSH